MEAKESSRAVWGVEPADANCHQQNSKLSANDDSTYERIDGFKADGPVVFQGPSIRADIQNIVQIPITTCFLPMEKC